MPKYVLRAPLLKIGNDVQSVSHLIQKINITTDSGSLYGHRGDEAISSTLTALYRIDGQKEIGILHTSILHLLLTSFCSNSTIIHFSKKNPAFLFKGTEVGVSGTSLSGGSSPPDGTRGWFTAISGHMKTFGRQNVHDYNCVSIRETKWYINLSSRRKGLGHDPGQFGVSDTYLAGSGPWPLHHWNISQLSAGSAHFT